MRRSRAPAWCACPGVNLKRMLEGIGSRWIEMARAIWSGSISFPGCRTCPRKLYSAGLQEGPVCFRELREGDGLRGEAQAARRSPTRRSSKGYEYAPDQYVVLGPRRALRARAAAKPRDRDPRTSSTSTTSTRSTSSSPYYLGPDKGAELGPRPAAVQALRESRKVAIARFVLRSKEHLAAIKADG